MFRRVAYLVASALLALVAACQFNAPVPSALPTSQIPVLELVEPTPTVLSQLPTPTLTPTPSPRHLSICLGREPESLFLYDAVGAAAQGILAALYDGPFETQHFINNIPIIVEKLPSLSEGSMRLEPVDVEPGSTIVDANGYVNTLVEGVRLRPSGCFRQECAVVYTGTLTVTLDQWAIDFRLLPELRWSDGNPLRADDSVFSFELAQALYPAALPDLLLRTASYLALDERTVEWKGVPGYLDADISRKFFSPLPRHAWGLLPAAELRQNTLSTRQPLGWGPYAIQEWVGGDHVTLAKNPNYFRAVEGLPYFEYLVFRFVPDGHSALQALLAGECDLLDSALRPDLSLEQLFELEAQGQLKVNVLPETAWEMALFGIDSLAEGGLRFFASPQVRRAVSMCLDRQAVVDRLFLGKTQVAAGYLPQAHPLVASNLTGLEYDPQRANQLFQEAGWVDLDGNPVTPRTAQGVAGIPDGTAFEFEYLVSSEGERQAVAEVLRASLAQCGVLMKILPQEAAQYLAPGPQGPVFGRQFTMAQFAWPMPQVPLCGLFLSQEIPGPYPEYPKGWGGANASGYSRVEYDQACLDALYSLPEMPGYQEAHRQAQELFAADLPAVPLYWRFAIELARPDLCGMAEGGARRSSLTQIELINYGEGCGG